MLYQLFWLFLAFSFLGWCLEVAATAVRLGQYRDRGVLHGPLCLVYGITGCLITIALRELSGGWFFLFLFSALYATVVEWIAGHLLEHYSHTRWWDYSDCKWNLDGYICLSASVVWGALGLVTVKWLVPLLMRLYLLVPAGLAHVLLWIFAILLVIDLLGTALTLGGLRYKLPRVDEVNNRLANLTLRMGLWIFDRTERRMRTKAPQLDLIRPKRTKSTVFAAGCSFYKIFLLFVIGAFLGDITETIFCRITAGYWMSRSSLVWGPFSIVWGLAIALVTQFCTSTKTVRHSGCSAWAPCWAVLTSICAAYLPKSCSARYFGITVPCRSTWAGVSICCTAFSGGWPPWHGSRCCSRRWTA